MRGFWSAVLVCFGAGLVALAGCDPDDGEPDPVTPDGGPGCLLTSAWFPVCGTDFHTYRNPGFAHCAHAGVLHEGQCLPGEGRPCMRVEGGTLPDGGSECDSGLVCDPQRQLCLKP